MFLEIPIERRPRDAERLADGGDVGLPAVVERAGQRQLLGIGQLLRPPAESPPRPRRGEPGVGPLPDQVALELGQRPEDVEDELAARGGGVDLLGQALEADPPLRQRGHHLDQVLEGAAQAIEPPDDEGVALSADRRGPRPAPAARPSPRWRSPGRPCRSRPFVSASSCRSRVCSPVETRA